jgi:sugar/nucleoside kinase (ribokinase family)
LPRLLAVGHVTWDRRPEGEILGGSAAYAALTARALGWDAAVLTSAGRDFVSERHLPGVRVFVQAAGATTRFVNAYDDDGRRRQTLVSRAGDIDASIVADDWRDPDALLLGPVAGELGPGVAQAFEASVVGALGQGWLREMGPAGQVSARDWPQPAADLLGVHALFLSQHDLPARGQQPADFLGFVPMVVLTRGWRGLTLITRRSSHEVPALPRPEVDPTGAGDVCAAAFLARYHETGDPLEAAAFGACAASCVVEGIGASTLGSRAEIEKRLLLRERLLEDGEWEE